MEDYKTRMINELNELVERIKKLFAFIGSKEFESLVDDEQQHLREQYIHMRVYEVDKNGVPEIKTTNSVKVSFLYVGFINV